jgi:hypothetical protein
MNQKRIMAAVHARLAAADTTAAELLPTLTASELRELIARRPELWRRYSGWLRVLPEHANTTAKEPKR